MVCSRHVLRGSAARGGVGVGDNRIAAGATVTESWTNSQQPGEAGDVLFPSSFCHALELVPAKLLASSCVFPADLRFSCPGDQTELPS